MSADRRRGRLLLMAICMLLFVSVVLFNYGPWQRPRASSESRAKPTLESPASAPPEPLAPQTATVPPPDSSTVLSPVRTGQPSVQSPSVQSPSVALPAAAANPVSIYYVDPVQYMTNHVQFLRDRAGRPRLNAILLPPDLQPASGESDPNSAGFIGSAACAECHQDYYAGFAKTSHHLTTTKADTHSIRGSFQSGKNQLKTTSPNIRFEMDQVDGTPVQRMLVDSNGEEFGADFQFDLVTGSGKLGQSYLYWKDERLYQLHVSYLTEKNGWVNSPGYIDGTANFARPVMAPCLECHATYFETVGGNTNHFRTDNFVLGVACERCHGPGRNHITHHRAHPGEETAHGLVELSSLSTEQSLDMCQVCHGGMPTGLKQPAFTYRVGAKLSEHYEFSPTQKSGPASIHSNAQLPRLKQSRCFQNSPSMTCTACHDPHQFERGNAQLFSDRCVRCHQPQVCGQFAVLGEKLSENCIDCHMPPNQAEDIKIASAGEVFKPTMRDHYIRISAESSDAFLRKKP